MAAIWAATGAGQALQVVFSTAAVFVALIAVLVGGVLIYRGRRRPGSRMRAVIDAGYKAVPSLVLLVAGLIGMVVGFAYLVVLFLYWLIYSLVASIVVAFTGGLATNPAEVGPLIAVGLLYLGIGLLLAVIGSTWLGYVIAAAVRRTRKLLRGSVYTGAPEPRPAGALTPPPAREPSKL